MARTAQRIAFAATLRLSGEDGSYLRHDADEAVELRAVRGQTPFREGPNRNNGGRITRTTDWIFDAADFREAVGRWPEDGDVFTVAPPVTLDGLTATAFRVTPTNGEPCYRLDATYAQLRTHTHEAAETTD